MVDSLLEMLYDTGLPLTLALDDLQALAGAEGSLQIIDHILKWAPANLRIAIAARVVPALRLQRLRLEDRLTFITHEELAFSPDETSEAVRVAGLDLDAETVEAVHNATGGWPAGVRMAILASREYGLRQQVRTQLRRDQALADYLATEVLASLTDELRDFVLDATLDEQVCPALIDTVRGTINAEALLEECLAHGLFLSRGSSKGVHVWFHWHPLFAAHVHRRLVAEHPERATARHAAAADWWSQIDGRTAFRHAVAAADGEKSSKIFADGWLELFLEGRVEAVLDEVAQVPQGSLYSADAHLARALILLHDGRGDEALQQVAAANDAAAVLLPPEAKASFEDRRAVVELFQTGYGLGLGAAAEPGAALLDTFEGAGRRPVPAVLASVLMFIGQARQPGADPAPTLEILRSSAAAAHDTGLLALELTALAESCLPAVVEGRLTDVHDLAVDVLARADDQGWVGLATLAPAVVYLGWFDYWRGQFNTARAQFERGLSMMLPVDWELRGFTLNYLARASLAVGDLAGARRSIGEIDDLVQCGRSASSWPSMLAALDCLVLSAEASLRDAVHLARQPVQAPEYPLARLDRAQVLLRAGLPTEALAELSRIPSGRLIHVECFSLCLEAEARATVDEPRAHATLEMALAAAERDRLHGPFIQAGEHLPSLLRSHLGYGTAHPALVTQILGRITSGKHHYLTGRRMKLTERERVILRYLRTNLTTAEIARAEYITVHTAKTHIAHIYQKLGVGSRRAATIKAAELELF